MSLTDAEATAIAGMLLDDRTGSVPSDAFDDPGCRALVVHWERVGRIALTADDLTAAAKEGGVDMAAVREAVDATEAMASRAKSDAMLREARTELINRQRLRKARADVERVESERDASAAAKALAYQRLAEAERLSSASVQDANAGDFGRILDGVVAGLAETHARGWLGLRLPSFKALDGKLCGLRGLMLLGAGPGVGKTQLTLQLGMDAICGNPGVGLVYLSLEMSTHELGTRLLCVASNLPYRRLKLGDKGEQPGTDGLKLSSDGRKALERGIAQLRDLQSRLKLLGTEDVPALVANEGDPHRWSARLTEMVEDAKRRMDVGRALVVVDNLQAIAVASPHGRPWASDMDRDRVVIEGLARLQHDTDDAVMVVSEVTKDEFEETSKMSAILGTGRNAYRADVVLLMKRRNPKDRECPFVDLIVDKGRDGMGRGPVALEWKEGFGRLCESSEQPK